MTASSEHPHQPSRGGLKHPRRYVSCTITPSSRPHLPPDLGPYEYTTIDKEASEIRLMTILPDVFGSEVRIIIQNHIFTESQIPMYEALSYVWGSNEKSAKIRIEEVDGDRTLAVTSNLAEALQYLRYEDRPRVLWIDAICVDQQNVPERGHQVSRMADIYRSASPVLVWLGPESASSDVAMRELSALGSTVRVDWGTFEIIPLSGDSYPVWQATPLSFSGSKSVLRSIENLLDRIWFKRLWIWQEVHLAKIGTQILCGDKIMLWETFRNAVFCFGIKASLSDKMYHVAFQTVNLCGYVRPQSWILDILNRTKDCTYSDPRDRLYAVLSLAHPHEIRGFEPDYSKSTEEVYRTFVMKYTATNGSLDWLNECNMREPKAVNSPSWVPDWTVPRECHPLEVSKACWGSKGEANFDDLGNLKVIACCVGTVNSVHDIGEQEASSIVRRLWRILGQEEDMGVAVDLNMDRLCRTLCCNVFSDSYLPQIQELPSLQESQALVSRYLNDDTGPYYMNRDCYGYESSISLRTENRAFFTTREGNIGLAPRRTKPGDIVCIVLGCQTPLVFRAAEVGNYTVVGECYLDGIMDGAGLLGKLPSNWQRVDRHDPDAKGGYDAFINRDAGIVRIEDPRLGPLPPEWQMADHRNKHIYNKYTNEAAGIVATLFDPRMSPEALKARGIDLQEYRLV